MSSHCPRRLTSKPSKIPSAVAFAAAILFLGCVGEVGSSTEGPGGGIENPTGPTGPTEPAVVEGRLRQRVWRLTGDQYLLAVRGLLGDGTPDLGTLPAGPEADGFVNGALDLRIDTTNVSTVFNTAARYAEYARMESETVVNCDGQAPGSRECAETFAGSLATDAYRRPLEPDELADLMALFDQGQAIDFETGVEALVHSVLTAPSFLYRSELGDPATDDGTRRMLTQHEFAVSLAYLVTGTDPDEGLWTAANNGGLLDPAAREAEVRRLFAESAPIWQDFFVQWLDVQGLDTVSKDTDVYPNFSPALAADMRAETDAFVANVIVEGPGTLEELFSASYTWASPELADVYGAVHPGDGVMRVELPGSERAGLLTQGSWLTAHAAPGDSSLEKRGAHLWISLLCQDVAPPPPNVLEALEELVGPDATKREIVEARRSQSSCNACHQHMDPIGVGLENYDGIGAFRVEQDGVAIDPAGEVANFGNFSGGVELAGLVANHELAHSCFTERFARYSLGTDLGAPDETDWLMAAFSELRSNETSLEELLVGLVRHPAFVERHVGGE